MPSRSSRPRARRLIAAAAAGALALSIALPGTAAAIEPPVSLGNVGAGDVLNINAAGLLDLLNSLLGGGGGLPTDALPLDALPIPTDGLPVPTDGLPVPLPV